MDVVGAWELALTCNIAVDPNASVLALLNSDLCLVAYLEGQRPGGCRLDAWCRRRIVAEGGEANGAEELPKEPAAALHPVGAEDGLGPPRHHELPGRRGLGELVQLARGGGAGGAHAPEEGARGRLGAGEALAELRGASTRGSLALANLRHPHALHHAALSEQVTSGQSLCKVHRALRTLVRDRELPLCALADTFVADAHKGRDLRAFLGVVLE
mmetsp:Transcript_30400/g.87111  ORF Transcript_30400/g.87111 Transcript_30400/m.87111 type:complete len:214 (+) Transcript_30400:339-980(+)